MNDLQVLLSTSEESAEPGDIIDTALETVRRHLNMDIAYLSEVVGSDIHFRAIASGSESGPERLGSTRSFGTMYCHHIVDGRLPKLIRDTRDEPVAMAMPITDELNIASHVSVPILRPDGSVFGMFCCLSPRPHPSLNQRDLAVVELFAQLTATQVTKALRKRSSREAAQIRIDGALDGGFRMVFQPIRDMRTGQVEGFEALSRFDGLPYRSPDQWFAEAARLGRSVELELKVIESALAVLPQLPPETYLSVNASPAAVGSGALIDLFRDVPAWRVVLEMTEHAAVTDYDTTLAELSRLRRKGLRLAIDDAGAGYSGLQHILRLRPDLIKLDMSLTREIDTDDARRSLAAALVTFARRTDARLVAEGVETEAERATLLSLGITTGQGYLLGRPVAIAEALMTVLGSGENRRQA